MRRKLIQAVERVDSRQIGTEKRKQQFRNLQSADSLKTIPPGKSSKYEELRISKPMPISTNRRGLFNWSRWNGDLWETTSLWAYHRTTLVFLAIRAHRELRLAQSRSVDRTTQIVDDFWCRYYSATYLATISLQRLNEHIVETSAISFLLRTAPSKIYNRLVRPAQSLDIVSFELAQHFKDLLKTRRVLPHREHNPMYFQMAVERFRRIASKNQMRTNDRIDNKKQRMQAKDAFGLGWARLYGNTRHVRPALNNRILGHKDRVDLCSVYPLNWTISPLTDTIMFCLRNLEASLLQVDNFLYAKLDTLPKSSFNVVHRLLQTAFAAQRELYELRTEFTALRYYRLHHFPDSFSEAEVELGKRLWQRMCSTTRAKVITKASIGDINESVLATRPIPALSHSDRSVKSSTIPA
jgi:hypothetical protein